MRQQLGYELDDPGFNSSRDEVFLFFQASIPALGPNQAPIQWVLLQRVKGQGCKVTHSPPQCFASSMDFTALFIKLEQNKLIRQYVYLILYYSYIFSMFSLCLSHHQGATTRGIILSYSAEIMNQCNYTSATPVCLHDVERDKFFMN